MRRIGFVLAALLVAAGLVAIVVFGRGPQTVATHPAQLVAASEGTAAPSAPAVADASSAPLPGLAAAAGAVAASPVQVVAPGFVSSPPASDGITADGLTAWGFATGTASDA